MQHETAACSQTAVALRGAECRSTICKPLETAAVVDDDSRFYMMRPQLSKNDSKKTVQLGGEPPLFYSNMWQLLMSIQGIKDYFTGGTYVLHLHHQGI